MAEVIRLAKKVNLPIKENAYRHIYDLALVARGG
jgi:hypothetical protein